MTNESDLKRAYAALKRQREASDASPAVDLEELRALAERPPRDNDGLERLDAILADPRTRDEYHLLREVVRVGAPSRQRSTAWLAMAAAVTLLVGAPIIWRQAVDREPVMRGADETLRLLVPSEAEPVLRAGMSVVWTPVAGATYDLSLLDENAAVAWTISTRDTLAVLPADLPLPAGGSYTLQVVGRLADGAVARAAPRVLTVRP